MKRFKNLLVGAVVLSIAVLVGCASNRGITSFTDGNFTVEYDAIKDRTFYTHKELKRGAMIYNLKDNISGERENISVYISNTSMVLDVDYQWSQWLFIDSVIILDNNQDRLVINRGERSSNVISGKVLRERYYAILLDDDIDQLEKILTSQTAYCVFIGSSNRTDMLEIKPKIKTAILETIAKYRESTKK